MCCFEVNMRDSIDFPTNDYLDISKFQHSKHGVNTLKDKMELFVSVFLKFPETWRKEGPGKKAPLSTFLVDLKTFFWVMMNSQIPETP